MTTEKDTIWMMTVPVLSTLHLSPETARALKDQDSLAFDLGACGFLIYCGEPKNDLNAPADIVAASVWARKNGSNGWIRFDSAGTVVAELTTYQWE